MCIRQERVRERRFLQVFYRFFGHNNYFCPTLFTYEHSDVILIIHSLKHRTVQYIPYSRKPFNIYHMCLLFHGQFRTVFCIPVFQVVANYVSTD